MFIQLQVIVAVANYFITFKNCNIDQLLFKWFLKLDPRYYIQKQKSLLVFCRNSLSVYDINKYFEKINNVI